MRQIAIALLLSLTVALSSCATPAPVLVAPKLDIPARPDMLPVTWRHEDGLHCLTTEEARKLLINLDRKDTHIDILEGVIRAIGRARP